MPWPKGIPPSREDREKISRSLLAISHSINYSKSVAHRAKLSLTKKGKPGHKHTEESKKKISVANLGKKRSSYFSRVS